MIVLNGNSLYHITRKCEQLPHLLFFLFRTYMQHYISVMVQINLCKDLQLLQDPKRKLFNAVLKLHIVNICN